MLMMAVLLIMIVRYLVRLNKGRLPKGDYVFARVEYLVFTILSPAALIALFVIEKLDDTLGVSQAVGSYAYWVVGGLVMALFTILMHEVVRLRRP
jgi:hypothetical protein